MRLTVQDGRQVFRLAYASRAAMDLHRPAVAELVDTAAENNRRDRVSGVLFSGNGLFLQWLEGPIEGVCSLMSRISTDPRHRDVTVLSAGWMPRRRFPRWPMRLAEEPLAHPAAQRPPDAAPFSIDHAISAFDRAAARHRRGLGKTLIGADEITEFAERLMRDREALTVLPQPAQSDLHDRAQLVDDVCAAFGRGWRKDIWSSAEITIGLAHLNLLWQRAGRVPQPLGFRDSAAVVVPPGSAELMGAIVKTDLLRASGTPVCLVLETEPDATFAALARTEPSAILLTGPRVGLSGEAARTAAFAEDLRAHFSAVPIHVGGRTSGPLSESAERLALGRDKTMARPLRGVQLVALKAMEILSARRR